MLRRRRSPPMLPILAAGLAVWAAVQPSVPPEPPVDPLRDGGPLAVLCVPDPQRGWTYRPGARAFLRIEGSRIRVRSNELGLRGPRVPPPAPGDTCSYRVLVVGGSNTFGWGVPERERYTEKLSARLAPDYPGLTIVNAGHWSYGLDQQLVLTREMLPRVRPDLVVQAVTPRAVALLQSRGASSRGVRGPVPAGAWAPGRSLLEQTRRDVLGAGARYLLVVLPAAPGSGRSWPARLRQAVGDADRSLLDLRGALGPELYAPSATWTRAGHGRVAELLAPAVRRELDAARILRQREDLARVRALVVSLEPAVGAVAGRGSVPELAAALRDFVHRRVPLKMSPPGVAFLPLYAAFRAAVLDPGVGHVCGGLAATYMTALEAFGIPARYVGMHTRAAVGADSHVSVEYLDGGRWTASDPTFDVTFRDVADGRPLSWLETRARLLAGRPVHVSTDGFRVARARRLESYYLPLATLLRYVVVYDDRDANGLLEPGEMIREPADWDGTLEEVNGERWRHSPSGVWVVLQSRPS